MAEFDAMSDVDQARAVSKFQMEWLIEASEKAPIKKALDMGFGCGFSAAAMVKGGCTVTSINYEAATVQRRVEAELRYERLCGHQPMIIEAATEHALPRLQDERKKFGLIFIDAGHRLDDVFIDVHYSKYLCAPGGILALDDVWYGAVKTVALWLTSNMGHIWKPHQILDNTASWTRTSADVSDWLTSDVPHRWHAGPPNQFKVITDNDVDFSPEEAADLGFELWRSKSH